MYGVFEVNRTSEIKFVDETPWCYHLNETYSAVLLPNTIMLIFLFFSSVRKGSTVNTPLFWIWGEKSMNYSMIHVVSLPFLLFSVTTEFLFSFPMRSAVTWLKRFYMWSHLTFGRRFMRRTSVHTCLSWPSTPLLTLLCSISWLVLEKNCM